MQENQTAAVQSHLRKLRDSDTSNKAFALKSLSHLVTQHKQQLCSCIQSIVDELDDSLSIEQNEVDIAATDLLQQIIVTYDKQQVYGIVKRRLLRQVVRNLGDHKMLLRKMSNKCLLEFIRRYHDYDTLLYTYLKQSLENPSQTLHLKQKCLNSLQSIVIHEFRFLDMNSMYTRRVFENIVQIMTGEESAELQKAAQQCLITLCRLKGVKTLIGQLSKEGAHRFGELRKDNKGIAEALADAKKPAELGEEKYGNQGDGDGKRNMMGTPLEKTSERPSLNRGFNQYTLSNQFRRKQHSEQKVDRPHNRSLTSNQDIAQAEQMLKRIQIYKNDASFLQAIQNYIPTLQINFTDRRTQLFTISVRIIQVILQIRICQDRFYIRLVPSIVQRLNDQKFLIRNCINKMIKQYLKTYTRIWIQNFFTSLKKAISANYKQDLISLLIYGYEMFYPIEFDRHEAVCVLARTAQDKRKLIRSKAIECIILVLRDVDRGSYEAVLRGNISADVFTMVMRRLESGSNGSNGGYHKPEDNSSKKSIIIEDPLEYTFKNRRPRLNTEVTTAELQQDYSAEKKNFQSIKRTGERLATEEGSNRRHLKKVISLQQQYSGNVFKLDQLTKDPTTLLINPQKTSPPPQLLLQLKPLAQHTQASPTRSIRMLSDGIQYIQKDKLQALADPKKQLQNLLPRLRDRSWKTQFEAVNTTRSLIQYHEEMIVNTSLPETVEEILRGVLSLRSSIAKNSLMCLDELINKLRRRLDGHSDLIVEKIMKKTLYTNEFLQGQVKKCLSSIASNFSESKLLNSLMHYRDHKSPNVKMNVLLIIQHLVKNERVYRKQHQTIWQILLPMIQEPSFQLRDMARRNVMLISELYPDYKTSLARFMKKSDLERVGEFERKAVQRNSKAMPMPAIDSPEKHVLEERGNVLDETTGRRELMKVERSFTSPKKYSTGSAGCTTEFLRLQQIQKGCRNFKDWKHRISSLHEIFKVAFKFPKQFCDYSNSARYITLLCEHIQDPNVRVSLNALTLLEDAAVILKPLVEDHLMHILTRVLNGLASKKVEIVNKCEKVYERMREGMDLGKMARELMRICQNPLQKTRLVAIRQLDELVCRVGRQALQTLAPAIHKLLSKLTSDQKSLQILQASKLLTNTLAQLSERR